MFHLPQVKFNPSESVSPCLIKIRKQLRMGLFSDLQNRLRNSGFWIFGALLMIYFAIPCHQRRPRPVEIPLSAAGNSRGAENCRPLQQPEAEAGRKGKTPFKQQSGFGFARRTGAYCAEFGRAGRVYYSWWIRKLTKKGSRGSLFYENHWLRIK